MNTLSFPFLFQAQGVPPGWSMMSTAGLCGYRERDVVKAGLRWINAERGSRVGHVGQVLGRCVNFDRLHPDELVWLSTVDSCVLQDPLIQQAIYSANWSDSRSHNTV